MNFEFSEKADYQEYFGRAHNMVRRSVKEFVDKEIIPYVDEWEEMGEFPRELYKKAGGVGLLGIGYPEELGGNGGDLTHVLCASEEMVLAGKSVGTLVGLGSLGIAIPPIVKFGTDEQKERFVKPVLTGEKVSALGITEPGGALSVSSPKLTTRRPLVTRYGG